MPLSPQVHLDIAAGRRGIHGSSDLLEVQFHDGPLRSAEHDKGYPAAFKVLLVAHVLVGGYKHVKTGLLGSGQQVAVAQRIPSPVFRLRDYVAGQGPRDALRRHMVKENEHSRGDRRVEAPGGELKHGVDLFPRDIELLNDLFYGGSGFEVLEHGGHGHAGVLEHPCAAQSAGNAFDGGALGPIESCHALYPPFIVAFLARSGEGHNLIRTAPVIIAVRLRIKLGAIVEIEQEHLRLMGVVRNPPPLPQTIARARARPAPSR